MLEGLRRGSIIVGGYSSRDGGVCPMLAAHRGGGRSAALEFAAAWDEFARARRPRRATVRELGILRALLEESLGDIPSAAPNVAPARGRRAAFALASLDAGAPRASVERAR